MIDELIEEVEEYFDGLLSYSTLYSSGKRLTIVG